jgi:hypothetical protein
MGGLVGQVERVEGDTLTMVTGDGKQVRITTTKTTLIEKYVTISVADLETGAQVIVIGNTNDDGSMTATSIQVIPQGRLAMNQQALTGQAARSGQGGSQGAFPGGDPMMVPPGGLGIFPGGPRGTTLGSGSQRTNRFNRLIGQVESVEGDVVVVKDQNGASVQVQTTAQTTIQKYASVTIADLESGERVTVSGSENKDGSITARSIQAMPRNLFNGQGGRLIGQLEGVEGNVLVITNQNNEQVRVQTDGKTAFHRSETVAVTDLQPGQRVTVSGNTNDDGSITAFAVQVVDQEDQGVQIVSVEDKALMIDKGEGQQVRVQITEETMIQRTILISLADLEVGEQVMVMGSENEDGSITAESVQVGPPVRFRAPTTGTQ